jgi:hypothetical protein
VSTSASELPDDFVAALMQPGFRMPDLASPDLAALAVIEEEGLGSGWWAMPWPPGLRQAGAEMWRLGDDLAVGMQRMDQIPDLQLKERRWLRLPAPCLPLAILTHRYLVG